MGTIATCKRGTLIDGVAANAAAASRTVEIDVDDDFTVGLGCTLVQSAATAWEVTLSKSGDGGATYQRIHAISLAGGVGTADEYTVQESVTGDDDMWIDVDVSQCNKLKVVLSATGGGAGDLLTLVACTGKYVAG